jgi:hypothetical protein
VVEPLSAATSEVKVYGQRKNQCKRKIFIALYLSCVPKKNRSAWNDLRSRGHLVNDEFGRISNRYYYRILLHDKLVVEPPAI